MGNNIEGGNKLPTQPLNRHRASGSIEYFILYPFANSSPSPSPTPYSKRRASGSIEHVRRFT